MLGDSALFFNPYEAEKVFRAVKLMLENEDFKETFHRKGLEWANLFTSKRMAEEFILLFKSTCES
jgi:hypothetical protein